MGLLLKPHDFSFHSSDITTRHQTISNRLIFITFFAVAFTLPIYGVSAAAVVEQTEQQDTDLQSSSTPCETKTLDDVPPDPVEFHDTLAVWETVLMLFFFLQFYDASDVSVAAAKELAEFILRNPKPTQAKLEAFRKHANSLANDALREDDNLLAFALAAPSLPVAVVQFRDKVINRNASDHTFLSIYWRELGIAWNQSDGAQFWGAPFKDCGPLQGRWLWPFSVTVVVQHVKTVASAFIAADQDACIDALEPIFGKRHSCDRETTFCLMTEPEPNESAIQTQLTQSAASRAKYTCVCREGFYLPNETLQGFSSEKVESETGNSSCSPCPGGCLMCDNTGSCIYGHEEPEDFITESVLKASIGAVLGACVGCCLLLSFIVFRQRKCKTIASGMWTILETILLGILFLYSAIVFDMNISDATSDVTTFKDSMVNKKTNLDLKQQSRRPKKGFIIFLAFILSLIIRYCDNVRREKEHFVALHFLPATSFRCMLEPWLREIGFIICYGAIVLKLYRHLVEFRTRKAHRYVVRDLDLLRYLCAMIVAVLCYLAAFTALCIDYLNYSELIWRVEMESVTTSNMCKPLKWDYVTQAGEMLILTFGIQLAYASRNANTQFRERQFLVASIMIEFVVSCSYYIIRDCYLSELNATTLFLALFIRSQLTNTITMVLIFLPKIYYQHKQAHESSHHHHGLSGYAGICIGDPETGDLTISEMSPEEIRAELKRLYTQLEYLKNKTLRQDNPHISKRRGGRKVAHRRFSLQALSAKHRNNRPPPSQEIEITEAEPSRTPEDSVCSIEGPTDTGGEISVSK